MLSLEDDCYESNINTSNPISLFQESPNFAEYESETPVKENTSSKVYIYIFTITDKTC